MAICPQTISKRPAPVISFLAIEKCDNGYGRSIRMGRTESAKRRRSRGQERMGESGQRKRKTKLKVNKMKEEIEEVEKECHRAQKLGIVLKLSHRFNNQ